MTSAYASIDGDARIGRSANRVSKRPVGSRGTANPPPRSTSRGCQPSQASESVATRSMDAPIIVAKIPVSARCLGRCTCTPARSTTSLASARRPSSTTSSAGIPALYARVASAVDMPSGSKSVGSVSIDRSGRSRSRTVARVPSRRAATSTSGSSRAASIVMRAPALTASSISAALLPVPFTEIEAGGTPASRASHSSAWPNVSQPMPSLVSTRRRASA